MTIRDVQHHPASTLNTDPSHETTSNITNAVLEESYPVLPRRDPDQDPQNNQVINRAAHIAVGVDLDGVKRVLEIWVHDTEGSAFGLMSAPTWPTAGCGTC